MLAAADFFTVEVWTPRGLTRFTVLVLIHLASRRVQIAGISTEPDGPGVTQLMRHATDAEDGFLRHIRVLIHDRDPLFRPAVRDTLPPADVTPIRRPARAPNLSESYRVSRRPHCLGSMGRPSRFSPEVRERAVRMVEEHREAHASEWAVLQSVAPKLGCTAETLRKWVRQVQRDAGHRPGLTTSERERLKELEREVRELKRANEILRKAFAYFAQAELDRRRT